MQEIQGYKKLSYTRLHAIKTHCLPRSHSDQKIRAHSERFMNKTDVPAMRALDVEMVKQLANEIPARMLCFLQTHVLVYI